MKKKISSIFNKIKKKIVSYVSTNKLFLTYVLFALLETVLIRNSTIKNTFDYKPFICDLALIIIIGSLGYLHKPDKRFKYYFVWLSIYTLACCVNSVYYTFYTSFASFSLLAELKLVGEVGDSVIEKIRFVDFMYIILPLLYYYIHRKLLSNNYYFYVKKIEKSKKMFTSTILTGVIILCFTLVNINASDISRLVKQWNRELVVQRFGIILYQSNDLVQSLTPKINSLFGYDEAAKEFKEYYANKMAEDANKKKNKYTGILEGMNVIFVHMESIQNYLVDMKINDQELTPTVNKLSKEGMYFPNFYPQISVGTSSDTEFTLNTSLMPVSSGTVFVSYYKRDYVSIPKLLKEKGYFTFSTHANGPSMWNRNNMHPSLGYDEMIFKNEFDIGDKEDPRWLGLGLNDVDFFAQLQEKLERIEQEKSPYMGTIIQLSNHSPFAATEFHPELYNYFGELDLTNTYTVENPNTGEKVEKTDDYLKGTKLGNYLISAHYSDMALGTFVDYVNESEYYDNTVFVFYGDHDARLNKNEYQYFYNYDTKTGEVYKEGDENYYDYNSFRHEINRKTPLIIWTKNKKIAKKLKKVNENTIGMYDVLPTIGNMMGFSNPYALGHDIYDIGENNYVIFPSGNFVTNNIYYSNTSNTYLILKEGVVIEDDYIDTLKQRAEEVLDISNNIIVHDLIKKEGDNIIIEEKGE